MSHARPHAGACGSCPCPVPPCCCLASITSGPVNFLVQGPESRETCAPGYDQPLYQLAVLRQLRHHGHWIQAIGGEFPATQEAWWGQRGVQPQSDFFKVTKGAFPACSYSGCEAATEQRRSSLSYTIRKRQRARQPRLWAVAWGGKWRPTSALGGHPGQEAPAALLSSLKTRRQGQISNSAAQVGCWGDLRSGAAGRVCAGEGHKDTPGTFVPK